MPSNDIRGWFAISFAFLGFLFGVLATFTCRQFTFSQNPDDGGGQILAGLYSYETKAVGTWGDCVWVSNVCVRYSNLESADGSFDYTLDSKAEALQKLGYAIPVIGGVFLILGCCAPCISGMSPTIWKGIGAVMVLCCILQGITLMMQASSICTDNPVIQYLKEAIPAFYATLENPNNCSWGPGFKLNISAVAMWGVGGLLFIVFPAPGPAVDEDDPEFNKQKEADTEQPEEVAPPSSG